MICSKCGTVIEKKMLECPVCHSPLAQTGIPSSDFQEAKSEEEVPLVKKKPMPLWFKWVSVLSVMALIAVTTAIVFLVI
jgi:hypothetical protein